MPPVVDPGRQRQADLADDLRPEVQGRAGILPGRKRKLRPGSGLRGGRSHKQKDTDFQPEGRFGAETRKTKPAGGP